MEDRGTLRGHKCVLFGSIYHQSLHSQEQSQTHKAVHMPLDWAACWKLLGSYIVEHEDSIRALVSVQACL